MWQAFTSRGVSRSNAEKLVVANITVDDLQYMTPTQLSLRLSVHLNTAESILNQVNCAPSIDDWFNEPNIDEHIEYESEEDVVKRWGREHGLNVDYELESGQVKAIGKILRGEDLLICFPTGYGKTICGIYGFANAVSQGKNGIFLVPLRSLATEHANTLREFGISSQVITSEKRVSRENISFEDVNVFVFSYEMFISWMLNKNMREEILSRVGFICADEVHIIGDKSRGAPIDACLGYLRSLSDTIQFVGLSATISNYNQVADVLRCETIYVSPEERPVPLETTVVPTVYKRKDYVLQQILRDNLRDHKKTIIFVASRKRSDTLSADYGDSMVPHHRGLSNTERLESERKFFNENTPFIAATPTLAQGRNSPADSVIIDSVQRYNWLIRDYDLLEANELIQMIGRAGRRGHSAAPIATAYLLADPSIVSIIEDMVCNPIEVISRIPGKINEIILFLIVIGCRTIADIESALNNTMMRYSDHRVNIGEVIEYLQRIRMISNNIVPLALGSMTAIFQLNCRTAKEIESSVRNIQSSHSIIEKLSMILDNDEFRQSVTATNDDYDLVYASMCLYTRETQNHSHPRDHILKAIGLMYPSLVKIQPNHQSISDIEMLRQNIIRLLQFASVVSSINGVSAACNIQEVIGSVNAGTFDPTLIQLCSITQIGISRATTLVENNITTVEQVRNMPQSRLARVLGISETGKIMRAIQDSLNTQ